MNENEKNRANELQDRNDELRGEVRALREEIRLAMIAIRGHDEDCSSRRPFLGTASLDLDCDCGFQEATESGLGRLIQRAMIELANEYEKNEEKEGEA